MGWDSIRALWASPRSWNVAGRTNRAAKQVAALAGRRPDVLALQEVTAHSLPRLRQALVDSGFEHVLDSFELAAADGALVGARRYGEIIASRYPLSPLPPADFPVPWPERVLSATITTPMMAIELHTTHIPPGSSNGWVKIEVLEGIHARLATHSDLPRVLCGDLNTPQAETMEGTLVTWGQRVRADGTVVTRSRLRGGSGQRWDAGERNVLAGLRAFDLPDTFRFVNGYDVVVASWWQRRGGTYVGRRFDHIFASQRLRAAGCRYVHALRENGLSDHSPIEADFAL